MTDQKENFDKLDAEFFQLQDIKIQMNRYDRWFKEISEKIGVELRP